MDMDPLTPKAVWGFNGTERPGAVYLAAVLSAYTQKGLPAFSIYGHDVQDSGDASIPADVQEKLLRFARAGLAVAIMRGKSYLSLGGVSMGIAGSMVDHAFFERYLGMRVESVDMTELTRRIDEGIFDKAEYERAYKWTRANCKEGVDRNPSGMARSREQKEQDWETSVKMALIARDLLIGNPRLAEMGYGEEALGRNAIVGGFQGQRQWTDHFPNGDFMEAILNSSFDWNGIRAPFVFATENDSLNGATMLLGHLLTNTAQIFADVRTYWSPESVERVTGHKLSGHAENGILHLINSGAATLDATGQMERDGQPAMKPFWEISQAEVDRALGATTWGPGMTEYFRGGGYSSTFLSRGGMPVTMSRINLVKGFGPVMQLAEGWTVDLPPEVHHTLDERTNPTWPTHWFAPNVTGAGAFRDVYSVMANWGANHGAISYGHIGADLIALASMLRIPVSMHNVPEEQLFRPSAWSAFGTADPEGADYRACTNFGPLYGRY
jgi:L-fucose isomerase